MSGFSPFDGAQWRGPIDVAAKRKRNVFFLRPLGKYNLVKRDQPFPDWKMTSKSIDGHLETVAISPSGTKYIVTVAGYVRLEVA